MSGLEKKLRERNQKLAYSVEITEYDKNAQYLLGWPGYRTAGNKSGLGYIETQTELAHMYGVFIKWLATGQFRTYNPVYLAVMTIIGLMAGGVPFLLIIHEGFVNSDWSLLFLLVLSPYIPVGLLLLVNVYLSVNHREGKTITGD